MYRCHAAPEQTRNPPLNNFRGPPLRRWSNYSGFCHLKCHGPLCTQPVWLVVVRRDGLFLSGASAWMAAATKMMSAFTKSLGCGSGAINLSKQKNMGGDRGGNLYCQLPALLPACSEPLGLFFLWFYQVLSLVLFINGPHQGGKRSQALICSSSAMGTERRVLRITLLYSSALMVHY